MLRILLPLTTILAACTPSPQKVAMTAPSPAATPSKNAAVGPLADLPEAAVGRRILSTAFVRVGPDAHLTVELHNGRVLVLRNVVMRPTDYCGVQVGGDPARAKFCGGYAEVAAARPGGAPSPEPTVSAAPKPAVPAKS